MKLKEKYNDYRFYKPKKLENIYLNNNNNINENYINTIREGFKQYNRIFNNSIYIKNYNDNYSNYDKNEIEVENIKKKYNDNNNNFN